MPDCIATELCAVTVIKHIYSSVRTASGAAASFLHIWSYDRTFPGKETTEDMPARGAKLVRTVTWPFAGVAFKQSVKESVLLAEGFFGSAFCTTARPVTPSCAQP